MRVGTQLKSIPTRVTTSGDIDCVAATVRLVSGWKVPAGARPSTPLRTWTWTMLPSASAARKTALPVPSGDLLMMAVATAP